MIEYTPKHLVMVTADANNNKYYDMIPNGDVWTAEYGRIGSSSQSRKYCKSQFETKYYEKIRKGYVDQTDIVRDIITEGIETKPKYKAIDNINIAEIVERLQAMAHEAIKANYTISSNKVTRSMIDEAQSIITNLLSVCDVELFNSILVKLFTVIPRKMQSVSGYIAKSKDDFAGIIKREQDLLDVMAGQVVEKSVKPKAQYDFQCQYTILDTLGLVFDECTDDDIAIIKMSLGSSVDKFHKAWRVTNKKTQERFDSFVRLNNIKDVRLLFHGSRNENWWSIIQKGLVLRPTNAVITGKMFGYGIYYATKARKSIGYTSLAGSYWANGNADSGFVALMSVAYGKPYDVYSFESRFHGFDYDSLQSNCPGANCLHAHAGRMLKNDEIIVYKEEQSTIKYLVELKG